MTVQTILPSRNFRIKQGMETLLIRLGKKYVRTFQILKFYTWGFRQYLIALVVFSILLGLMETFQIVLLYPILNASFNLQDQGITFFEPLYNFRTEYGESAGCRCILSLVHCH